MLGQVTGVWAAAGRIYVVDSQVPTVRVYDWGGGHLFDIGRKGEGPGEFIMQPAAVATLPNGDVVVSESGARLHRFTPDGTPVQTLSLG